MTHIQNEEPPPDAIQKSGPLQVVIFDLIRHGQSTDNHAGDIVGSNHAVLTSYGIDQAKRLGELYARRAIRFDILYHSGLPRTQATQQHLVSVLPPHLKPGRIIADDRAIERQHPEWDGKPHHEIYTEDQIEEMNRQGPDHVPGKDGESFRAVAHRKRRGWLYDALREAKRLPGTPRIGLVGHGNAIRCLIWDLFDHHWEFVWRTDYPNTAVTRLIWNSRRGWFASYLGTPHLPELF